MTQTRPRRITTTYTATDPAGRVHRITTSRQIKVCAFWPSAHQPHPSPRSFLLTVWVPFFSASASAAQAATGRGSILTRAIPVT
jgi:hypothetical protein